VKTNTGEIDHIKVKILPDHKEKLKGYIHWVSKENSIDAVVRLYNYMFTEPEVGDDWITKINPESLIEKPSAKVWNLLSGAKEYDSF
jgi:glutaminyl-tRNA synthetase